MWSLFLIAPVAFFSPPFCLKIHSLCWINNNKYKLRLYCRYSLMYYSQDAG